MASGARKKRRWENQEDIKYYLEEIWDSNPDYILCKIFSGEAKCGIEFTTNLSKEDLEDLRRREDNGNRSPLIKSDKEKRHSLEEMGIRHACSQSKCEGNVSTSYLEINKC